VVPEHDLDDLSDLRLLELARPRGWRAGLRTLGCPIVLAAAGWLSWSASSWVGLVTWSWLGWVVFPFLFLPIGVLFSALLAVVAGRGTDRYWLEVRRRIGQMPLERDRSLVRADLADRADDQKGWVILLRGARSRDRLATRLRLDLRTDTISPCGEVRGVRGPRLDTIISPPSDLARWERLATPLSGSAVAELSQLLNDSDLGSLPRDRQTRDAGWTGLIVQVATPANEWTYSTKTLTEGTVPSELVRFALDALGWDPTGSPLRGSGENGAS